MAATPTNAELMAMITQIQVQVNALQNAAPAAAAAPPAGAAPVVFADMPQMLGANDLINYLMKGGSAIFKQGCKALNNKALADGFVMTPDQTVVFVEAFHHRATMTGWNQGARQITTLTNSAGRQVNIIKSYGQINKATLKTACERFCNPGEPDSQTRPKQNNTMVSICLAKSLTTDAQARLLTYRNEYTFDGVKYTPLMYKIIVRLATSNSIATTQTLCGNLQPLGVYVATVSGNINKVHNEFDKNYSQLIARRATIDNPIGTLFEAYLVVPCHNFKAYFCHQHKDYLNGKLTAITKALRTSVKRKYDWLKTKRLWGAKSPDKEKIVVMTAVLTALKGQLKLDPKLSSIVNEGNKKGNNKGKKKKNKKNMFNLHERKQDEAWKKELPKGSEKHEKQVGKYTYHWCEHHMAWTVYKPADCLLGKQHKEEQKKKPQKANSATFAAAAATMVNPHFTALMALMANLEK
jgi:hypothetical protein